MKKILSLLLCAAMLAACLLLVGCADVRAEKYENALSLLADKKHAEAQAIFAELGDYKNAQKYLSRFWYIPTLITFELDDRAGTLTLTFGEDNLPIFIVSDGQNTGKNGRLFYDEFGRVIRQEVTDRLSDFAGAYDYTFDENGYVIAADYIAADGTTVSYAYTYNENGDKLTETYTQDGELWVVFTYTYDEEGRMVGIYEDWGEDGSYTYTYTFDERGLPAREVIVFSEDPENPITTDYTFNEKGWHTSTVSRQGEEEKTYFFTYDAEGRCIREEYTDEDGEQEITEYVYDENDNEIKKTLTHDDGTVETAETEYVLVYVPHDLTGAQFAHMAQFWEVFN